MRSVIPIIAALVTVETANVSLAQSTATPRPESGATCPPDVKGEPPTVGGGSSEPLSDKLAQSKGVIRQMGANTRPKSITSDQQIGALTAAVGEIDVNAAVVLLDALEHISEMITLTINCL